MRKEVEDVIKKEQVGNGTLTPEFEQFLIGRGLTEKIYAPRKYKGISIIESKEVTFDVKADDEVGDKKTISFNGEKQTVTIEKIEIEETDVYKYPRVNNDPNDENYQCHYTLEPISLTDEERTALYALYERSSSPEHQEKPIVLVLNIIGIVICILGFILGMIVGYEDEYDFDAISMIVIWAVSFVQATMFFAIAAIIQLLNKIQWQQVHQVHK